MASAPRLRAFLTRNKSDNTSDHEGIQMAQPKNQADTPVVASDALMQPADPAGGMGRHLGLWSTTNLIIGRIIGTGIFSTPSSITSGVGSVGAALLLWTAGALISFCGLAVWLELGCMFPMSGGEKVYLEKVYQRPKFLATIIFSVQAILLGFTAQGCIVFASNILLAAGHNATAWESRGIAVAVITFVTILHIVTPKIGVKLMNLLSSIKVVVLLFIVGTGLVVLGGGVKSIPDPKASFRHAFAGSVRSPGPYATALFKVINSYAGWNNAAYVLNEVKEPQRTLKVAAPLGLFICAVLFIFANVAYFTAATPQEIAKSGITVASYFVGKVCGPTAQRTISVFIALSALGNVLTVTFAQARVNQELAKEGAIPFSRFWASNWPNKAPSAGLLLHFIPSLIVIVAIPAGDAYAFILDVEGYPLAIINLFVVLAFLSLRYDEPIFPRQHFKAPLPMALVFLVAQLFLIIDPFLRPPNGKGDIRLPYWLYPLVGIAVLLMGVLYWFIWMVLWPMWGRFEWEEKKTELVDGTVVREFVKKKD